MAFKRNLPLLVAFGLLTAGLLAVATLLKPTDEERLGEAVAKYASSLGAVQSVQVFGNFAEIQVAGRPVLFAEFVRSDGAWVFAKDLGADFEKRMHDPEVGSEILKKLAERIAEVDNVAVNVKEGLSYQYVVARDGNDVVADVHVRFSYPKPGDVQGHGLFSAGYRYKGGTWQNESYALRKQGPTPRR